MNQNIDYESDNVTLKRRVLFIKNYQRLIYESIHLYQ